MTQLIGIALMFIAFVAGYSLVRGWPPPRGLPALDRREGLAVGAGLIAASATAVVAGVLLQLFG